MPKKKNKVTFKPAMSHMSNRRNKCNSKKKNTYTIQDKDQYEGETNENQGNENDEKNHNNECETDGNLSMESADSKGSNEGKRKLESIKEDSGSEKIENTCQSTNKQDHDTAGDQQSKDKHISNIHIDHPGKKDYAIWNLTQDGKFTNHMDWNIIIPHKLENKAINQ
ncbi:hypothetical protein HAX54_013389, partial [Datura stramonium]|nr:hypothetical protein [Datura stramonium]